MKKKNDLKKLALLGITGGVLLTSQAQAEQSNASQSSPGYDVWSTYAAGGCASCRSSGGSSYGGSSYSGYTSGAGCGGTPQNAYYSSCSSYGGYSSGDNSGYGGYSGYSTGGSCASAPTWGGEGYYGPSYDHDYNNPQNVRSQQHQQNKQQQIQQYQQDHQQDMQQQPRRMGAPTNPPSPTTWRNTNKSKLYSEGETTTTTTTKSILTDSELRMQLSEEGKRTFDRLDPEGKKLALKLANQGDPNQAVRDAAKKMDEKRANLNSGTQTNSRTPAQTQTRTPGTYR